MDASVKNLREWVGLLFALFCVLDIVGVQYGMMLSHTAALQPDYDTGRIAPMLSGGRGDWRVRTETRTRMRATAEHFLIDAELDAYEGERRVFSRNWHARIPRDLA